MSQIFFTTLTAIGEAKHANAAVTGTKVNYKQMAVGDGNGEVPMPDRLQTKLVNQKRREDLNSVFVDPLNSNQIVIEQAIPEKDGGWWVREAGIYDEDDDLIAVASVPPTYKPVLQEGSGRMQVIRMVLLVSSAAVVSLKIDPSIVMATQKFVNDVVNAPSGVVAKTYGGKTKSPIITVDARGRVTAASEIVVASVWETIPTEYIGDIIFVKGLGEMWWVDNEFLTGYRTKECGFPLQNIDRVNRSFTIALDGGFFDKTLPKFKGLYSIIREHNLLVAESAWIDGEFFFCEAGNNMVKLPNQDDMFWRNKGTDKDAANVRALGSKQAPLLESHSHTTNSTINVSRVSGSETVVGIDGSKQTSATGGAETRPVNTALHPRMRL